MLSTITKTTGAEGEPERKPGTCLQLLKEGGPEVWMALLCPKPITSHPGLARQG